MSEPSHPSPAELEGYAGDELAPQDRTRVEAHVKSCPQCQHAVERSRQLEDLAGHVRAAVSDGVAEVPHLSPSSSQHAAPTQTAAGSFVQHLRASRLLDEARVSEIAGWPSAVAGNDRVLAKELVGRGLLTRFQAERILGGQTQGFRIGPYVVTDKIGRGGMGRVYKAVHQRLKRTVALKVLPRAQRTDPEAEARFLREARAGAQLNHPNIVTTYDVDDQGDITYLAMEYVDGQDLYRLVRDTGPLSPGDAAGVAYQVALGLEHARKRGIVHRDVKPSNILIDTEGCAKILDMGLARIEREGLTDDESATLTQTGAVMGTVDYIAPEQAEDTHKADTRADIYSLGCTLYHTLAGQVPFPGGSAMEKLYGHGMREPEDLRKLAPAVPDELAQVVAKMMAKKPDDRYQTPAEAAEALLPWVSPSLAGLGGKGARNLLPAGPKGCFAQKVPGTFSPARARSGSQAASPTCASQATLTPDVGDTLDGLGHRAHGNDVAEPTLATRTASPETPAKASLWERGPIWVWAGVSAAAVLAAALTLWPSGTQPSAPDVNERRRVDTNASPPGTVARTGAKTLTVPDQYPTIQEAIDAAEAGDRVLVKPGTYREILTLKDGVHLSGTERDTCRIQLQDGATSVLKATRCRTGSVRLLTFHGRDVATSGEPDNYPAGMVVDDSTLLVQDCAVWAFGGNGIMVTGVRGSSTLRRNYCAANGRYGIYIGHGARGTVQENVCEKNSSHGIKVISPGTAPILRGNRCRNNRGNGINFWEGAAGTAEANLCVANVSSGITVNGRGTAPTLKNNQVSNSGKQGISVSEGAAPLVEANVCTDNARSGILFCDGAAGKANRNRCDGNARDGITVRDRGTKPVLRANLCRNNRGWGIIVSDGAVPLVGTDNVASGNKRGQIRTGTGTRLR